MNIEIVEKEYSASVDVNAKGIHVNWVAVEVAGVSMDVHEFMPAEAWDALYAEIQKRFQEAGGETEEKRQQREYMRLVDEY